MRRREFLGSIGLLAAAFGMPWPSAVTANDSLAATKEISSIANTSSSVFLQSSALAGFQFHAGNALWSHLRVRQPLTLVREAENTYDGNAIRVEWNGEKIGYVPRRENSVVAELMDRGEQVTGCITQLSDSDDPWQRVRIDISLEVSSA